jgi:uncharacterized protein (DUF1778 family)
MDAVKTKKTKEARIAFRLDGDDLERVERAAAASKLAVATWVRREVLTAAERQDPQTRRRLLAGALGALETGVSRETLRRLREAPKE